jgi:hypothetical protein
MLLALLLLLCNSSDASTKWTVGSSDGANFSFAFRTMYQVHRRLLLGYHRFIRRCLFFFFLFSYLACGIFASLGPRNVYKDMLNNMVSPIDHVVMNHENHTRTNGIWGHVHYISVANHLRETLGLPWVSANPSLLSANRLSWVSFDKVLTTNNFIAKSCLSWVEAQPHDKGVPWWHMALGKQFWKQIKKYTKYCGPPHHHHHLLHHPDQAAAFLGTRPHGGMRSLREEEYGEEERKVVPAVLE